MQCTCPACPQLILETASEGILQAWLQRINAAMAQLTHRQAGTACWQLSPCPLCSSSSSQSKWLPASNRHVPGRPSPPPPCCRPRRLLVFLNPFGGSRRARQTWDNVVKPVFDKAGVKSRAVETQHGGHAHTLLTSE